jgi:hypothetical protein
VRLSLLVNNRKHRAGIKIAVKKSCQQRGVFGESSSQASTNGRINLLTSAAQNYVKRLAWSLAGLVQKHVCALSCC